MNLFSILDKGVLLREGIARRLADRRMKQLQQCVIARKAASAAQGATYDERPEATAVLQFYNHREQLPELIQRLRTAFREIIVIDDGSIDGSYRDWPVLLDRPNDFLLRCNDLFEVRTYDRAIRMARAPIVCLLQDDDLPPPNDGWLRDALALFDAFPMLAILGGRRGYDLMVPDQPRPGVPAQYGEQDDIAGCPGINKYRIFDAPTHRASSLRTRFMFTMFVNRAPMFVRRDPFLAIGGIRQDFAPFQCDDVDCCLRAWKAGWRVGLYSSQFAWNVSAGGMRGFCGDLARKQVVKNWTRIYADYTDELAAGTFREVVRRANEELSALPPDQVTGG